MRQCGIQTCPKQYSCGSSYTYWRDTCGKKYRTKIYSDINKAVLEKSIDDQWKSFATFFNSGNLTLQGLTALGFFAQDAGIFAIYPNFTNGLTSAQGAIGQAPANIFSLAPLQALYGAGFTTLTYNVKVAAYLGNWNYLVTGTATFTNANGFSLNYAVEYTMTTNCEGSVPWNNFAFILPH